MCYWTCLITARLGSLPRIFNLVVRYMSRLFISILLATLCVTGEAYTNKPFGEYYPHTRWIDRETYSIQVDAYPNHLVVTRGGKSAIIVHGCWRGRAFLRDCTSDYSVVAHEGRDAGFVGDRHFEDVHFRRVPSDPNS
jgi:hypothetical protein